MTGVKWSYAEVEFIKRNFLDLTPEQMKEKFLKNRSVDAIKAKIYDLGLYVPRVRKRCKVCGKLVKSYRRIYCSRECRVVDRRKFRLTREQLYNLYIVRGLSAEKIAEEFNVGETTVFRWLKKYGISTRNSNAVLLKELSKFNDKSLFVVAVRKGLADSLFFTLKSLQNKINELQVIPIR